MGEKALLHCLTVSYIEENKRYGVGEKDFLLLRTKVNIERKLPWWLSARIASRDKEDRQRRIPSSAGI